ncbi:MAG: STM4504/CBY_0614 family protein [Pseudohongiellaceae bacterium]
MAVFNIFSKRQKRLRGEMPDVYVYDEVPQILRVQISHIIRHTIGDGYDEGFGGPHYKRAHETLCKEYGLFQLEKDTHSPAQDIMLHFLSCKDYGHCLDIIEILFCAIEKHLTEAPHPDIPMSNTSSQSPSDAIEELNTRFKEAGIGYEFNSGKLRRIDSKFIHSEVIKPVFTLLKEHKSYKGANEEFLDAHEHYRHKKYKECLVESLKSLESLMKGICTQQKWQFNQNDTAKKLINTCLKNELVPNYLQEQLHSLEKLLESGVPTIRNKEGAHGQGATTTNVPEHYASYALHLTASNLLFLMQCHEQLINKGSGR